MNSTTIFTAAGKPAGQVIGQVWRKVIHSSRGHILRIPPSLASDVCSITQAEAAGAARAEFYDADTGTTYTLPMSVWRIAGRQMNRRYGEQIYVGLNYWTTTTRAGVTTPPEASVTRTPAPSRARETTATQLSMWDDK